MANKQTCPESDALAAALLTMDEEVAQRYVEQIAGMNALEKAWDTATLNIARAQLNGMINATILKDWAGSVAKEKLVEQMSRSNIGTKKYITDMLNTLDKFSKAVADGDNMQPLYNILETSNTEWEAIFSEAVDKWYQHFSNKYALNEAYKVLDDTVSKIEADEIAKKAESKLVDNTYDILISKGLVDDSNVVDFVERQDDKIEELKKERKDYIKKNKVRAGESDEYLDELELKIKRYENIVKKFKADDMYKKANRRAIVKKELGKKSKKQAQSSLSDSAVEYADWIFSSTQRDAISNYKADATERSKSIVGIVKSGVEIPNTDATYIAMRDVLGSDEAYNNYVVARVLLSEWNEVVENVLQKIWVAQLFDNALTKETINNIRNMEDLVGVAFSYTKDLKDNKELLDLFLQRKDFILGNVDTVEKLGVINALYNIWYYGENYTTHMKYDIFATRLLNMWYELPVGESTKSVYQKIGRAIVDNVNFKTLSDGKTWFADWKALTLEWKDGKKIVISWDDLRRLMPAFLPANAPFSNFKDVITIAWYDDYLNKLEYAVKDTRKTAVGEYDDIAQRIKWEPEVEDVAEENIFDQDKLEALKQMYDKMISDPKADDRSAIFLKALTRQTIDTKKTLLLSSSFDNTKDVAENQVKADLYNWLADQNSIPVTTWIKWYKPSDIITEDIAKDTEFILIEWGYIDDDMRTFINNINKIREENGLAPATKVKNKMYNKGRFYIKDGELRFSIITSADYDDFVNTMLEMGLDFSDMKNADVPWLLKMYADYVDAAYGGKDANAQLKKISNLLWLPGKTDSKGRLIVDKNWDIAIDVVSLDQYVKDVTETTGKFKTEVVDLSEKWNIISGLEENSILMIANRFADEVGLPWVKDIKGIDIENAKELLFASMYNTDIVKAIQAKYAFLKTCGITGIARETDKIATINYLFNKQLRLSWYNMWVLQSDDFIRKIVNGEDISDDLWTQMFMKANAGNPEFMDLVGNTPEEKMVNLINNVKETIQFDNLKNELSFPDSSGVDNIEKMAHEWEQAVYKMLVDPTNGKTDWVLWSLEKVWLYLWMKGGIKNAAAREMDIVMNVIDEYTKAIQDAVNSRAWYQRAIELKQELQFALSTINNKVILPSYIWLVPEETLREIAQLWTNGIPLNVADTTQSIEQFMKGIEDIKNRYRNLSDVVKKSKKEISNINPTERAEKAVAEGVVNVIADDGYITTLRMDDVVKTYIDWIKSTWLKFEWDIDNLLQITESDLRYLSNKQKYEVFKKLSLIKKYTDYYSLYKQTYYKMHTLLASSDFFTMYKLGEDGYPVIFRQLKASKITDANIGDRDIEIMAQRIYDSIMTSSFTEWKTIWWSERVKMWDTFTSPTLDMVSKAVSEQVDLIEWLTDVQKNRIQKYMESIFNPYTELQSIPRDCEKMVKKILWEPLDQFATAMWFTKEQALAELWDLVIKQEGTQPVTVKEMFNMTDSQEMLPNYIRYGDNQKVSISQAHWVDSKDVNGINKEINKVNDIMLATVNDFNVVTDLDRATAKDSWRWVGWLFRRNTLLNQIARAEDRLFTEGNEISALLKDVVFDKNFFWFRKRWLSEIFPRLGWWQLRKSYLQDEWRAIKTSYNRYYNMSLWELENMDLNDIADNIEWVWLRLALYFKKLWDMLGSVDWLRWVTTDIDINRALYNIGDCINYIDSAAWVLSLSSGMNNFQILKFVKVIKDWPGYNDFLRKISQSSSWVSKKSWEEMADETTRALLWTWLEAWDINRFNELFNGDYTVTEAQRIIFALWWFQRDNLWNRYMGRFLQWWAKSSLITRIASSYPFWILPVPLQQMWYSVKRNGLTKWLWVSASDLSAFHTLRKRENVLVWWYFEFTDALNPKVREELDRELVQRFGSIENFLWSVQEQYSRLWDIAIVDNIQKYWNFLKWDDFATFFRKLKSVFENPEARKLLDNTKENANNIIDWLNSSAMKDLVFAQAVMRNNVYKFYSPEDYYLFMRDPSISEAFKRRVREEIIIQANRSFIDTMWLGWGATRAVVARNWLGDAMLQIHNFINFRGQWGTTIARNFVARMKQIFWVGWYIMKNIWKPWLSEEVVEWFMRTPEMQNFVSDLYSAAYWWIHAQREATRNYDDDWGSLSFFDQYNTLSGIAMFLQWLSSWGRGRIISSWFEWFMWSLGRDLSVWDALWVAWIEMLEEFFKNFGRQFKFEKFISDWLMVASEHIGDDEFDLFDYVAEQFWNLSKGSLRYMTNEQWYNNYSDLRDNTWPRRYVAGTNTNKNNIYLSHRDAYDKWLALKEGTTRMWSKDWNGIDTWNVVSDITSQWTLAKVCLNIVNTAKALYYQGKWDVESMAALSKMSKDVSDITEFSTAVENTVQWQQLKNYWYYVPQDPQWIEDLSKKFIRHNAPGWGNAFARLQDYAMGKELKNVWDDEAYFLETIGKEGVLRIIDKVDDVYHDKNSTAYDKRRAMIMAASDEVMKHQDDPLYPELQAYLYKGIMSFQYDWYEDQAYQEYKTERNAGIQKKKDYIAEDKTDWLKYEGNKYRLLQEFVLEHNEEWSQVDTQTYKSSAFKEMVRLNEETFNQYVEWEAGKDENGEDILEPKIKSKYRTNYDDTLKAVKLFENWDAQWWVLQMSLLTKRVDYYDDTWFNGWVVLNDQMNYIDELPNLTVADKALAKFQLLNNNYAIARKIIENREIFWDDSYIVNLVSQMRYDVDNSLTEAIQEVAQSYETGNDGNKKSGWSWATLSKLKASKIALDKLSWSDRGNRGNWWSRYKPSFDYWIEKIHWSEYLRWINSWKSRSTSGNAIKTVIHPYKEVPLVTQPKELGKPKKIKGKKKKVKNK